MSITLSINSRPRLSLRLAGSRRPRTRRSCSATGCASRFKPTRLAGRTSHSAIQVRGGRAPCTPPSVPCPLLRPVGTDAVNGYSFILTNWSACISAVGLAARRGGKTTVARLIARRHGLRHYHADAHTWKAGHRGRPSRRVRWEAASSKESKPLDHDGLNWGTKDTSPLQPVPPP